MRISDWSSDVCSSDLYIPMECARPESFPVTTATHWHCRFTLSQRSHGHHACKIAAYQSATVIVADDGRKFDFRHKRSEERRVGKECVSPCRSRWSPYL